MLWKDLGSLYWFIHNNQYIGMCDIIKSVYVPNAIELWGFRIRENMRGKGYGQQFLCEIIQEFNNQTIVLFVEKTNERALHIYHKLGFKIVGEYRGGDYAWEMRLER